MGNYSVSLVIRAATFTILIKIKVSSKRKEALTHITIIPTFIRVKSCFVAFLSFETWRFEFVTVLKRQGD